MDNNLFNNQNLHEYPTLPLTSQTYTLPLQRAISSSLEVKACNPQQLASLDELLEHVFSRYSKVLVVRVDFGYRDLGLAVTYQQAKDDLARFISSRRDNSLFNTEIGMAWALEHANSLHFHTIWFFNGHKVQKDGYMAQELCKRWKEMTDGRGRGYNCNRNAKDYKHIGIGMIHRDDHLARQNLHYAASYLCKEDSIVRSHIPKGARAFGRTLLVG